MIKTICCPGVPTTRDSSLNTIVELGRKLAIHIGRTVRPFTMLFACWCIGIFWLKPDRRPHHRVIWGPKVPILAPVEVENPVLLTSTKFALKKTIAKLKLFKAGVSIRSEDANLQNSEWFQTVQTHCGLYGNYEGHTESPNL